MYQRRNNRKISKAYVIYLPEVGTSNARLIEVIPAEDAIIDNITATFLNGDTYQHFETCLLPQLTTRRPFDAILADLNDAHHSSPICTPK